MNSQNDQKYWNILNKALNKEVYKFTETTPTWIIHKKKSDTYTYIRYHFPSCLVPFSMIGLLFQLLQNSFPGSAILQCKLTNNSTKLVGLGVCHLVERNSQPQQELVKPKRKIGFQKFSSANMFLKPYLFIILRWMMPTRIIRSAQSAKKSDIFTFIIVEPSCLAISFKWSQEALQSASNFWMLSVSSSKSTLEARVIAPI